MPKGPSEEALSAARGLAARAVVTKAASALGSAGIRVMPLKGVLFLALSPPGALARPMRDVDIMVDEGEIEQAEAILRRVGLVRRGRNENAVTLMDDEFGLDLDVHSRLFPYGAYRMDTPGVFSRGHEDCALFGVSVVVPSGLDVFAHLVGHFVCGRLTAADQRHVADFELVARLFNLQAEPCAEHLCRLGLVRAGLYALGEVGPAGGAPFVREVRSLLGRDPRAGLVARVAGSWLRRWPRGDVRGVAASHLLGTSVPRGVRSLASHALSAAMRRATAPGG